jgi:AcrR family transcriptional regulator
VPRAGLTPAAVVAEASAVADESGLAHLTMASVALRLGVALPSLYKHVHGLEDLQRLIAVQALRDLGDSVRHATVGRSRGDALRALADAYWDYAHRHPGRYAATLRAPDADDPDAVATATALRDVVCAVLRGYGVTGDDAVDATRMLRAVLHGYVALRAAGGFAMPRDVRHSFHRAIDALDVTLADWVRQSPSSSARSGPRRTME